MPRQPTLSHEERTARRLCSILAINREIRNHRLSKFVASSLARAWSNATDPIVHVPLRGQGR